MKKLYIVLTFSIISTSLSAQNKSTKSADKLFNRLEYVAAAKEYQNLVDQGKGDAYVYKQLADSYYNVFDVESATKWYAEAISAAPQDAETYYRYSQMLKAKGKYDEANKQMVKFASLAPNDLRAKSFNQNPNYIPKLIGMSPFYTIKEMSINSDKQDFGAVLYDNTLYFTSARNKARKIYAWNNEPYLDIYKVILGDGGVYSEPITVDDLNTKRHDGPLTMSADGNTVYFSRDSFNDKLFIKDKANNSQLGKNNIYKATFNGEKWDNVTSLPFNSKEYSTSNPSLSRDGKTLYFSSNMPGSIGGVDIWKVAVNSDGTYGTPENLGPRVNTEGNESFPFISDDNKVLFFASTGKLGLGGLDVFQVNLLDDSEALNLGKPVNSERDDFAFSFNSAKNIGYYSTNRNGNDDIYEATPICALEVLTLVTNGKTGDIISNATVAIVDDKMNVIATESSSDAGEVKFKVECDKAYSVQVSKDGFESNVFAVTPSKGPQQKISAALQPIEVIVTETEVILNPIYFENDRDNITQQAAFELDKLVQVMKNNEKMVIFVKSHTDIRGKDNYNMSLSERRAKSTVQYVISKGIAAERISAKGYGESELKIDCKKCTEEEHAQNRRSEFLIVK